MGGEGGDGFRSFTRIEGEFIGVWKYGVISSYDDLKFGVFLLEIYLIESV